jgi:hypothetical protein
MGALVATIVVALGSLAGTAPAGATTGSVTASCVLQGAPGGPEIRTFPYEAHAPESVAEGATAAVSLEIGYPVPPSATAGFAEFTLTDATGPVGFSVPGGAASIHGSLPVTATGPVGSSVVAAIRRFGAFLDVGGRYLGEICTPLHTFVVATIPIGVPSVSVGDAAVVEGAAGTRALSFPIALSRPAPTDVTVAFDTEDVTAVAGADYVARSGTVTVHAGFVSGVVTIRVRGDRAVEPKETFRLRLHDPAGAALGRAVGAGRIVDDDPEPGPRLSIGDGAVTEGLRGTRSMRVTVSLSEPATGLVTFHYATAAGSAVAGEDYRTQDLTWTITPGDTSRTLAIPIVPDGDDERSETFTVRLAGATGAVIGRTTGVGTILDDD